MNGPGRPGFLILTSGTMNSRRVARLMTESAIDYDLVMMSHPRRKRGSRSLGGYLPLYVRDSLANVGMLRRWSQRKLPAYPVPYIFARRCNGPGLLRILAQIEADYILMMGGGILTNEVIQQARKGVLNAHPGLLPQVRGVDVLKHALLRDQPLAVTGHFIDPGIDTGDVITRYLLPIDRNDSFDEVAQRAHHLSCAVIFELVLGIAGGDSPVRIRQAGRFPLCHKVTPAEDAKAMQRFHAGRARELYEESRSRQDTFADGRELLRRYAGWWKDFPQF